MKKKITLPLIGDQLIETVIITNNFAQIKLEGFINNEGYIKYYNFDNKHLLKPSYNLRKIIKKYNIEIDELYYNDEDDSINFNINIKTFRYSKNIKLNRLNW